MWDLLYAAAQQFAEQPATVAQAAVDHSQRTACGFTDAAITYFGAEHLARRCGQFTAVADRQRLVVTYNRLARGGGDGKSGTDASEFPTDVAPGEQYLGMDVMRLKRIGFTDTAIVYYSERQHVAPATMWHWISHIPNEKVIRHQVAEVNETAAALYGGAHGGGHADYLQVLRSNYLAASGEGGQSI